MEPSVLLRWGLAALHLLALGIGLGAVWARARALNAPLDAAGLGRVFYADNLWGLAAVLWLSTGLVRALGGVEKGTAYYLSSDAFRIKMALFGGILALEVWPMATLIGWRRRRGAAPDTRHAAAFARISRAQAALVLAMVVAATALARGIGF